MEKILLNAGVEDEVLILNDYGIQIRIYQLIDSINKGYTEFKFEEVETQSILKICRTDGLNQDYIMTIGEERSNQPLIVSTIQNKQWVIDGNHRLEKRIKDKRITTKVLCISEKELEGFTEFFSLRL